MWGREYLFGKRQVWERDHIVENNIEKDNCEGVTTVLDEENYEGGTTILERDNPEGGTTDAVEERLLDCNFDIYVWLDCNPYIDVRLDCNADINEELHFNDESNNANEDNALKVHFETFREWF